MAKTNWQDPQSTEIRSTHISGLQDAIKKLEEAVDLSTVSETNIPLNYVLSYNPETGLQEYRIYQAPEGKRNWLVSPAPVIKKNGVVITDGFTIDYGGGAIILSPAATANDVFTADVTYTTNKTEPAYFEDEFTSSIYSLSDTVEKGQLSVESIQGNTATNIIKNGNFAVDSNSDGIADGWYRSSTNSEGFRIENNAQYWTPLNAAWSGSIHTKSVEKVAGHKYYIRFEGKNINKNIFFSIEQTINTATNADGIRSLVFTATTNSGKQDLLFYGKEGNVESYLKDVILINLTQTFGTGSEPTKEECDKRFPHYIDSTKSTISALRLTSQDENEENQSYMYTKAVDDEGHILPMRSLPNNVQDELYVDNGQYKFKQNIGVKNDVPQDTVIDYADMATGGQFVAYAADGTTQVGVKGDILTIDAVSLNYQLATPVVTPAEVIGHLDSHPNGTIIVEPIVADFDFYDEEEGIIIKDINVPIKRLDKVIWTDKETGYEVDITDTCTVAGNKLGFTSTYAVEGDLIWYEYEYDSSMTTLPTVSFKAPLNSKAVIEDLVKAKGELQKKTDNLDLRVQGVSKRVDSIPVASNFIIAPSDAINKERADLVLTGVPADDLAAINNAITMLHTMRASVDVAIRIDFLGGTIDVGTKTDGNAIVIPVGYDNIYLYGNGVKLTGYVYDPDDVEMYSVFTNNADNVIIDGFNIVNNTSDYYGYGLSNTGTNCTITGNTCSSDYGNGLYNTGANCTITGNTCSGMYNDGLYNTGANCTISGNTCSGSDYGDGLYNTGANCTITSNTCNSNANGLFNTGTNCTITGNTCSGSDGDGLFNSGTNCTITSNTCNASGGGLSNSGTNCTITGNTCSSDYGYGLYNSSTSTTDKCIITGNICLNGGISVKSGTCLPATQEAMADVNSGTIEIRP